MGGRPNYRSAGSSLERKIKYRDIDKRKMAGKKNRKKKFALMVENCKNKKN